MNLLKDRSLKRLGIYAVTGLFLLFIIQFFILRVVTGQLEQIEEKKDFTRSAQMNCQQIAYLTQHHLSGNKTVAPQIYAKIKEHNGALKLLSTGGRIPETSLMIDPMETLPRITLNNLVDHWKSYQSALETTLTTPEPVVTYDSIATMAPDQSQQQAKLMGEWITVSHWYDRLIIDLTDEVNTTKAQIQGWFIGFLVLDALVLVFIFIGFHQYVLNPLKKLKQNARAHIQDTAFRNDETGSLATEINEILEQLKDATDFVAAIGDGKLDFDYKTLDDNYELGKNRLADSLVAMQEKLKVLNIEEQRRQWANEGLTKFVDILRSSNDNINSLGDKIISALVKYTNSNQGGLYILNDEDERNRHLELISLFAFDIKKFEKQRLKLGEGILGQTFLEKETTVLNEIPEEYVRITSGLGGSNPKSLLIVPLKVDQDVYGIVELASFKDYQPHEIAFVEKLAETIASTLASVKVAHKNRFLIEQFQQQTEEMRSQEEEMRQNMEELQATQEELSRKELDYISRIRELENTLSDIKNAHNDQPDPALQAQYEQRINELERELSTLSARPDDWELAQEVEKTLRFHIDSLRAATEAQRIDR